MNNQPISIFWFRRDLRLHDNAGFYHALKSGLLVLPIFIFDPQILDKLSNKADKRVTFIHQQLHKLKQELTALGSDLLVQYATPQQAWQNIIKQYDVKQVYTNHDYEPYAIQRDQEIGELLTSKQIGFNTYKDQCIFEYNEVLKDDGKPYTVFTPYSKKWKAKLTGYFVKAYPNQKYFNNLVKVDKPSAMPSLASMGFEPSSFLFPGTEVAQSIIKNYDKTRDFPGIVGTSKLGIHFRFGTISIREKARKALALNQTYLNELIWRDFYMQILAHFPHVTQGAFRPEYDLIEWRNNEKEFDAFCQGKTGYPIVDAGMRELNTTGYMHNRVRMIVASFLTKHLLIDWRWGEAYFAEKLLDFDLSANNGGWQWAAGCGTDAAPYFRVFNPYLQTERFDKQLTYIKKWVPEVGTASYPKPIVDHDFARKRCLEVYKTGLAKK
jgi:deoxyribodipyrimidine photo-lyase